MNYDEPEWNAENMNRKKGDTTFDICGWCEYVGCGMTRYDCCLDSSCNLMKDYGDERNVKWNTKCIFKMLSQIDLKDIIKSKEFNIDQLKGQIENLNEEIKIIKEEMGRHKNSPPLPPNRINDYDEGEVVYVVHNDKWERGIVVPGYRSHDGMVSFVLDDIPESKKGWGCGVAVPSILKEWEYQYFTEYQEDYEVWKRNVEEKKYNGEKIVMPVI